MGLFDDIPMDGQPAPSSAAVGLFDDIPADASSASPKPSVVKDVAKAAGAGYLRGAIGLAGFPADLARGVNVADTWIRSKITGRSEDEINAEADTLAFVVEWLQQDGSDFPWSDYGVRYVARSDCGCWSCMCDYGFPAGWAGAVQNLSQGASITVDQTTNQITIALASTTGPAIYTHACRLVSLATQKPVLMFDGRLTISKGAF